MDPFRRRFIGLAAAVLTFAAWASAVWAQTPGPAEIDLSAAQAGRPVASPVPAAIGLIAKDYRFATPGTLTVAIAVGRLPFSVFSPDDNSTPVGSEPDIARLIAGGLGLKLSIVPVAWADWPLGLQSGKFDAVISNVTVTELRKEKFDFSTYRNDQLGLYVKSDSPIQAIRDPRDIAGLKVIVGAATNQEQILLRWNEQNVKAGLKPVEIQYFDDDVLQRVAIQSGRADVYFGPNAIAAYQAAREGKTRLVGTFPGGWPNAAQIAVTTRKGAGLADAITRVLNQQIANGNYAKVLARWNLTSEGITESQTNPPGLPKS
jgi:polar amino acid transport system substrate-binding protein